MKKVELGILSVLLGIFGFCFHRNVNGVFLYASYKVCQLTEFDCQGNIRCKIVLSETINGMVLKLYIHVYDITH